MMRADIQKIIEENGDPEATALKIVKYLDDELGLSGNGWFDNDPKALEYLEGKGVL